MAVHSPATRRFTKANSADLAFGTYRKKVLVQAVRIEGPFDVETKEGDLHCEDGFLALDSAGYPHPIATQDFAAMYEAVG